ncbi:MAG: hypothetical protein ABSH20_04240 [Tepidisphaeraceae bacterium]|jgi:hypothetical protein
MRHGLSHILVIGIALLTVGAQPAGRPDKLKFKGSEGFSLKLKEDGLKVVDDKETELARIRVEENGNIKIKDAQDTVLGYVVGNDPRWNLKDARQEKTLFQLTREATGDLKLEDGAGALLCHIRSGDAHAEIEGTDGKGLFRVQTRNGKTSIRDSADKVVLTTDAAIEPQVAALFVLKDLTLAQRAAFWLAMEQSQKVEK